MEAEPVDPMSVDPNAALSNSNSNGNGNGSSNDVAENGGAVVPLQTIAVQPTSASTAGRECVGIEA